MTAEELIIGHYDRSLSPEQEAHLSSLLDSQPEVRALYEQHGTIDNLLVAEAETIDTTSKMDKVVIAAALGTLVEIAGKGIGISLLGKLAAVVGVVAVGTVGYILLDPFGTGEPPARPTPAVRAAPAPVAPAPTAVAPLDTAPAVADAPADTQPRPAQARPHAAAEPTRPAAARPTEPRRPALNLGNEKPTKVETPPTIRGR